MTTTGLLALRESTFPAMGTEVRLVVPRDVPAAATGRVRALFATWEAALTRFRPDSELSRLNRAAGSEVEVSPLLFGVLQAALRAARATDGLFDPAMGLQMEALGYDRPFDRMPRESHPPSAAGPGGGWRAITLDPARRAVTIPHGRAMDLGGIAKGMAVDAAIGTLRNAGVSTAMVEAGGDLRVIGRPPAHPHWGIRVDPVGDRVIALKAGALATSSTARRRWRAGGGDQHHLIDPRTGRAAMRGVRSVTVAARTCAQAEVAAKAALVAGMLEGADLLRRLGMDALMVPDHGTPLSIGRWPAEEPEWT